LRRRLIAGISEGFAVSRETADLFVAAPTATESPRSTRLEPGMIARDVSLPTIDAPFGATGSCALFSVSLLLLIGP